MNTKIKRAFLVIGASLVLAQLVPVDRTNPPVETALAAPADVQPILKRSCYDCHSNLTRWPWYSKVAPVSWLVGRDVHEGRRHLNFSAWNQLTTEKQQRAIHDVWRQVSEGEMPMTIYLPLHSDARLSDADKAALKAWADATPIPPGGLDRRRPRD